MTESGDSLRRTRLYDWHVAHGARTVAFAGWSMPVQYPSGVSREHVATRTRAGLFDICHMGRFRISGPDAIAVLGAELTNDAAALAIGRAHYTLLANEAGGALDDAYLYRLGIEDFLLVVNAANRAADRMRLHDACIGRSVRFADVSEPLAMLALQGPHAERMLVQVLGAAVLPHAGRNHLRTAAYRDAELIVARTGYTGEPLGFELFAAAERVVALWQALIDAGAVPAGLGARDSLRLEAGLPLYGHELGRDRDGRDIPIFAHRIARFGVRKPGNGRYVGVDALDAQRAELDALLGGAWHGEPQRLPQLVQPIAAPGERRPLRAGYTLHMAGEPVGYVTSGTSVPAIAGGERVAMRSIGLALVRTALRYDPARAHRFDVHDARGAIMHAEPVASNLVLAAD